MRIQDDAPEDGPLTFVNGAGVILANLDFIAEVLDPKIQNELIFGRVENGLGVKLRDWVTVRARSRILVRGDKNVSYRCCGVCGRHVYFAMGRRYLYPSPPHSYSIHETDLYGFVIPLTTVEEISWSKWPKVAVEELPVVGQPADSLGELS